MNNSESLEKVMKFSKQALEHIDSHKLHPTPENYELWYVYFAEVNPEINRAVDMLKESGQTITEKSCSELYERFLGKNRENDHVRKAGNKIQEAIEDVSGMVSNVKSATSQYNQALTEATQQISDDIDKEKLEAVLGNIMSNTQDMMQKNAALEERLAASSHTMQELQSDLERVRQEALTDSLTNLANRKAFDAEIKQIADTAQDPEKTFSLILMDIDHFKNFNDNYGHQVGDQVLRLVAKTLKDGVKGRDLPARYGGEEFAIILPDTPLQAAVNVANQLRKAVAGKEIVNRNTGDKLGRITLSGGCGEYKVGESIEDMIDRIDAALYVSKNNGRNQISKSEPEETKKEAG